MRQRERWRADTRVLMPELKLRPPKLRCAATSIAFVFSRFCLETHRLPLPPMMLSEPSCLLPAASEHARKTIHGSMETCRRMLIVDEKMRTVLGS